MDESNQDVKRPMGREDANSSSEYTQAAIDTSNKENIIDEIHLDLVRESKASSKNATSDDKRQEERRYATSDCAYETAVGASDSELKFALKTNATSKSEDFSAVSDIINKDFLASKKQKSSHGLLDGSNGQKDVPSQDDGTHMILNLQEFKLNIEENMSFQMNVTASSTGDVLKKAEDAMRRERRKQANRESAKRSRLRKQQEREELEATASTLNKEVSILAKQLRTLSEDCAALNDEINSLMGELEKKYGPEAVYDLKAARPDIVNGIRNCNQQSTPNSPPDQNQRCIIK